MGNIAQDEVNEKLRCFFNSTGLGWTDVNNSFPKDGVRVLGTDGIDIVVIERKSDQWKDYPVWTSNGGDRPDYTVQVEITHWMALPSLPINK